MGEDINHVGLPGPAGGSGNWYDHTGDPHSNQVENTPFDTGVSLFGSFHRKLLANVREETQTENIH